LPWRIIDTTRKRHETTSKRNEMTRRRKGEAGGNG